MYTHFKLICLGLFLGISFVVRAQVKVGDNPTTINANSALEIEATNRGLLLPRVALVALDNASPLTSHIQGMQIYNTTEDAAKELSPGIYYNDGAKWVRAGAAITRTIIEGDGAPTIPCTEPGIMYTDINSESLTAGKVWICSGGSWIETTTPTQVAASTPFRRGLTNLDAGGNKEAYISRSGSVGVHPPTYTGSFSNGTASVGGIFLSSNNGDVRLDVQRNVASPNLVLSKDKMYGNNTMFLDFRLGTEVKVGNTYGSVGYILRNNAGVMIYATSSDVRLKENIQSTRYSIDDLLKIQVSDYNYKSISQQIRTTGFLAQQLHTIYPEAVSVGGENPSDSPWSVDYGKLTPLLVKAVQDQHTLIKEQEKEIELHNKQLALQQKEILDLKSTINERLAKLEQKSSKSSTRTARRSAKKAEAKGLVMVK